MIGQRTLALTNRGLRVDQRMTRTYLIRLGYLILIYMMLVISQQMSRFVGAAGLQLFSSLSQLNFWLITLAGISYFSNSITEEKEDQTLGLLKMAGINSFALLLGKTAPRLLGTAILLTVQFPFTLLAITLGGVTIKQVIAAYCALLAYLILVATIGLFSSVVCYTSRRAAFLTSIILFVLFVFPYIGLFFILATYGFRGPPTTLGPIASLFEWCRETFVWERLTVIMTTGFDQPAISDQVISNIVLGLVFFGASWALFGRLSRNEQPAGEKRGVLLSPKGKLRASSPGRAWTNAIAWKDFHFVAGGRLVLVGKFFLYFLLLMWIPTMMSLNSYSSWTRENVGGAIMGTMLVAILAELALMAGRIVRVETRWNTLPLLTMVPISTAQMFWSKVAGCMISMVPACFYFFVGMVIYPEMVGDFLEEVLDEPGFYYIVSQYLLFLHLTVYMSLVVRWGALPLSFGIMYIVNMVFLSMMAFSGPNDGGAVVGVFFSIIAMVALHFSVANRLRTLASR